MLYIKASNTEVERFKVRWILLSYLYKYRHKIANNFPMIMRMMYLVLLEMAIDYFNWVPWIWYV